MKTLLACKKENPATAPAVKICGIILLLLVAFDLEAQYVKTRLGLQLGFYDQVSANGYGSTRMPMLSARRGKNQVFAGAAFQKGKNTISGLLAGYSFSVTGKPCGESAPELYFYINSACYFNAQLGKRALWEEHMANKYAAEMQVNKLRFKSVELFGGTGLRIHFCKRFVWDNSIGLGAYGSFRFPDKAKLYHSPSAVGLQVRTGISFRLR